MRGRARTRYLPLVAAGLGALWLHHIVLNYIHHRHAHRNEEGPAVHSLAATAKGVHFEAGRENTQHLSSSVRKAGGTAVEVKAASSLVLSGSSTVVKQVTSTVPPPPWWDAPTPDPVKPGTTPNLPDSILVATMTGHFFGQYEGDTPCTIEGKPLRCTFAHNNDEVFRKADALWYHVPSGAGHVNKHHPEQLAVAMSMESDKYYPRLCDKEYMRQFDLEMSYRTCSQVPVYYFDYHSMPGERPHISELFKPIMPLEQKVNAIAYVNSNCGALSGRSQIMRDIIALNDSAVPTHAWGACDRNMRVTGSFDKVALIHKYKFCVAMENSISKDYVTEKLWQALEAGCVPIYLGATNVKSIVPDPDAVIHYQDYGSPAKLMAEVRRLAADPVAYNAKLAWKHKRWEDLSPSFLAMTRTSHVYQPHTRCQLCRLLAYHKVKPKQYTTCLFNETWLPGSGYETSPHKNNIAQ